MAFVNFEKAEDSENKIEQEQPEKKEFEETEEKHSLGNKLKDGLNKLFHKDEAAESPDNEDNPEGEKTVKVDEGSDGSKNQILDTNESRKEIRDKKLEEYDNQLFNTVKKHGEMLDRRTDLSPDKKNEMQTEMTENYKKAVDEYKDWLENESDYRDLPEE